MRFDRKGLALLIADVLAVAATALAANYLRFDVIYPADFPHFDEWLLLDIILTPIVFFAMGLYRSVWRYASISDIKTIVYAVGARTILLVSFFIFLGYDRGVPRSTTIIQAILLLGAVGAIRLFTRMRREMNQQKSLRHKTPVLIIGAGDAGEIILRELRANGTLPYRPAGFIDDDPAKWGVRIHGVPVLGGTDDIPRLAPRGKITDAIIAIPSASGAELTRIYKVCKAAGVTTKTVPPVSQLFEGRLSLSQIRNVELEDLLGREPVSVDFGTVRREISGRRVLITGGAGSIGRELARQVAELGPERLMVVDRNENSIYFTEMELRKRFPGTRIECVVGDILDNARLGELMESCEPQIVFHAAAFKHVPMMELNAVEAFKNNVLGTRNVARKASELGVERFVLISTDKAVNPISVMGGTKRVAELVLQEIDSGVTRFVSVRFGNVLGSDGSVIPLFKKQIAEGGPVTVTHPEVSRYFMTITEAVQLVLQAASMGKGGEVFLLDMGQPIKIVDLARNLIELSGFRPDEDIEIVFTGLRLGEKLHEELYHRGEEWLETSHEKILKFRNGTPPGGVLGRLSLMEHGLLHAPSAQMDAQVRKALSDLIPEFGSPAGNDKPRPAAPRTPVREAYI